MAKKRQFDEQQVLDKIAQYFWQHGYASTKVDQLSALTGLTKSSIYNAFGNKETLFMRIVDFYVEQHMSQVMRKLDLNKTMSENIAFVFTSEFLNPDNPLLTHGCLMTNSIIELSSNEPKLYDYVSEKFTLGRRAMFDFFAYYVDNEKVILGVQAEPLSELFMTFRQGLKVQSRSKDAQTSLKNSINTFIIMMQRLERNE